MKINSLYPAMILGLILIISCKPRTEYNRKLARELNSGKRNDSLFLGLYLGMPEKDFYVHCWRLNKKGLIRQGETNTTVKYDINKGMKHPVQTDFYPRFMEGRIYEMPVRFFYKGWAPWNKELSSEKLQQDVLSWYLSLYGSGFIKVRHPKRGIAWVKIDGNRRITIFNEDELHVWAVFTDMLVKTDWPGVSSDTTGPYRNVP